MVTISAFPSTRMSFFQGPSSFRLRTAPLPPRKHNATPGFEFALANWFIDSTTYLPSGMLNVFNLMVSYSCSKKAFREAVFFPIAPGGYFLFKVSPLRLQVASVFDPISVPPNPSFRMRTPSGSYGLSDLSFGEANPQMRRRV
ncbi:hypothetical protein MPTK1_6g20370 [Marchantia polymorpha subsp. ruderalis]|uniref:Uncharacterized protein n=2 Tax=Marchantia polymorpha TaxID=3197 RepID=A0AAF6BU55_MARPO|nr:hypothetical protein MARPO_0045s0027 [Marchantia polymorpha]BBN15539.1 hypothetical protein Mp_6g20370 [Marchantia polymorpha subsp. ruderalis]|eukprot:PTQ39350.1 hypothetical protein MARPO_0045s0027 [Marchantia polymorpha]